MKSILALFVFFSVIYVLFFSGSSAKNTQKARVSPYAKVGQTLITKKDARLCSETLKCIEGVQLITKIPKNTKLVISDFSIGSHSWGDVVHYQVSYNGKTGWISDIETDKDRRK